MRKDVGLAGGDIDNCPNDVHSFETKSCRMIFNSHEILISVIALDEYNSDMYRPVNFKIENKEFDPSSQFPGQKVISNTTYNDCYEFIQDSNSISNGFIKRFVFNKTYGILEVNCKGGSNFIFEQ